MTFVILLDSAYFRRVLPGEAAFFKARKLSQPQSSCIYTSIELFEESPCFLAYFAGEARCCRPPARV